jgi:hypothetical protein
LGLHADSSIRENVRRERGLCLAGFQKRIWLSEKQLLNLRCHRITMVQATESRKGLNLPFTRRANFCRPTCWRVVRESEMRSVRLGLVQKLGHVIPTNAVSMFHALQLNFVSGRIASYAMHGAGAIVLVNVMRIPCFGRRMTIGRASIIWPGAN